MISLDDILASRRLAARELLERRPLSAWRQDAILRGPGPSFLSALRRPGLNVIAEIKRSSPSAGAIRPGISPGHLAKLYEKAGASAISVLTEPIGFAGSLDDLREVRESVGLPVLRKDFLFDPVQVYESKLAGADVFLIIVRFLSPSELKGLVEAGQDAGLDILAEVHDEADLERALAIGLPVLGVNCRDLATMKTDLSVHERMRPLIPPDRIAVAESGIRGVSDLRRVAASGYDAALIGETLMRAPDPETELRTLLEGVRESQKRAPTGETQS